MCPRFSSDTNQVYSIILHTKLHECTAPAPSAFNPPGISYSPFPSRWMSMYRATNMYLSSLCRVEQGVLAVCSQCNTFAPFPFLLNQIASSFTIETHALDQKISGGTTTWRPVTSNQSFFPQTSDRPFLYYQHSPSYILSIRFLRNECYFKLPLIMLVSLEMSMLIPLPKLKPPCIPHWFLVLLQLPMRKTRYN